MSLDDIQVCKELMDEIYEDLSNKYNALKPDFTSERDVDNMIANFISAHRDSKECIYLLHKDKSYYFDKMFNDYDEIIEFLADSDDLDNMDMSKFSKEKMLMMLIFHCCNDMIEYFKDCIDDDIYEFNRLNKLKDYSDEVNEKDYNLMYIEGATLKNMNMARYFNNFKIDNDEVYDVKFYNVKYTETVCMARVYFKIEELCEKVHFARYNTSSTFAIELGNFSSED